MRRRSQSSSKLTPVTRAAPSIFCFSRSVTVAPGSRLLMVTLCRATWRDSPPTKPVSPARAPFDSPSVSMGMRTALDVILTMRPKRRATMPSSVALMSSMGASMLASMAAIQCSRVQFRKSPGGGPPALLTRMSGSGQAARAAWRPISLAMSAATAVTVTPVAARISAAVAWSASAPRATIVTFTPSCASASAQARPRPLLAAHTSADLPCMPRSMFAVRKGN